MLMFQLDIVYYIWRVLTNSSNRGSVRVILPYSEVSITPFLLSRSLYTENNPEFISSFSLISFTFSSPLTDISNNIFLSSSDSSDQILLYTYSTTKYMDGHGATLGGAIVDSGKFDWMAHADKYPGLCTPDDSYHGITYAEKFGKEGAFITKCTAQLMRDFGSMQSPQNAFMLNLGLERNCGLGDRFQFCVYSLISLICHSLR